MREIKFRAWDKEKKEMTNDFSLSYVSSGNWLAFPHEWPDDKLEKALRLYDETGHFGLIDYSNWYGIEEYEIMQYTGLKDKNGKEIYCDDIVAASFYKEPPTKYCVVWNPKRAGFSLQEFDQEFGGYPFDVHGLHDIKIIGNIYENPEISENPT